MPSERNDKQTYARGGWFYLFDLVPMTCESIRVPGGAEILLGYLDRSRVIAFRVEETMSRLF